MSAKCLEMKEHCAPLSNNILASAIVELCCNRAIAVLSKVVVLDVGKQVPAVRVLKDGGVTEISLVQSRATLWLTGMGVTGGVGVGDVTLLFWQIRIVRILTETGMMLVSAIFTATL